MNKEGLIPELRFPDFKNMGEWEINEFGELINILADYTANGSFASLKENVTYYSSEEYAVLVRTTDLDKKIFTPARFTDKRGYEFLSKTSLFGNEIVMANVGSIGKVFRVPNYDKPMTLAPNTYVLKFNDFVDEDFIYQLMLRSEFEKKLLSMVGSSTLMAINKSNLRSIKVSIPAKKEQQHIASCLSSIDEVITAHSQKLELLKNHKKGLMQNLFPQEGETVPKYRFKEFEKDGGWLERKLGEVAQIGRGISKHRPRDESSLFGGIYPFIQTGDIRKANLYLTDYTQTYSEKGLKQSKLWDENTLCITIAANIAETAILKIKACFPDSVIGIIPKIDITEVLFINYLIESFKLQIQSFSQGMAQDNLNQEKLSNLVFLFPSIQEQQKIASCLSSLDAIITTQAEKIEQLKLHKKGLMQGLFPKIID